MQYTEELILKASVFVVGFWLRAILIGTGTEC
jgi:hypothetical protein